MTYVDVAYALKNHIKFFRVQNAPGKFTTPGFRSIQSAASLVKKVPANNEMHIVDPPATGKYANAYPICTFTCAFCRSPAARGGSQIVPQMGSDQGPDVEGAQRFLYIPVPKVVQKAGIKTLGKIH